jgi:outer membrane protein
MKKILAFLGLILFINIPVFADPAKDTVVPPKIAVVNMQQVLMQSSNVAAINARLQKQFKPQQEKLAAHQKAWQDEVDQYNKVSSTLSQKERITKEKKLADDKAAFLKEAAAFQKEVTQAQNKAMQGIVNKLSEIVFNLAKKNGDTLVLDSQAVLYSSNEINITKQVAQDFNK